MLYDGPARALVRAWKEHGVRRAASLAAELVDAHIECPAADVITYIPPDPARQLRRAVHPAQALAGELAARWQLDTGPRIARTRTVARQAGLAHAARRRNVRGLFAVPASATDMRVVLVDDVYTTGATAAAAAAALRRAGAADVHVVTLARTPR